MTSPGPRLTQVAASVAGRRVLVLSAPVGAGHDAAATSLAAELRAAGAVVDVVDGLALLGVERLVVGGYRFQILHAGWSWRLLYRATRSRTIIRLGSALLARLACRRLVCRIAEADPDVVVSAYPIVSAALAGLRRRARLPYPCATLVTDFDPHPAWIHPDLDANLVVGAPGRANRPISPPTPTTHRNPHLRDRVRTDLEIDPDARVVLIVGGAWGVGNLTAAARAVAATPGAHAIVVTGHNHHLHDTLTNDPTLATTTVLGFTRRMRDLMAASDVLIQNAGGLTCLEAFAARLPVIMFDPLPGHGEDNTRHMARAGLVAQAATTADLQTTLASASFWDTHAPALVSRASRLFDRPSAGAIVADLARIPVTQPGHVRRLAPAAAASLALGAWFIAENPPSAYAVTPHTPPTSHTSTTRTASAWTRPAPSLRGRETPGPVELVPPPRTAPSRSAGPDG